MATSILEEYIQKIECLKRNKQRGVHAPHKPILLLAVIELIEQGLVQNNRIPLSCKLVKTFEKYWSKIVKEGTVWDCNIATPFFHLQGKNDDNRFWWLHSYPGCKEELDSGRSKNSVRWLRRNAYASFDEPLFFLLINTKQREIIREAIISRYFPNLRLEIADIIEEQGNIRRQKIEEYSEGLMEDTNRPFSLYKSPKKVVSIQRETPIRSASFRKIIIEIYNQTCAVCRLHITKDGKSITDAAHIVPFSESYNDDVRNGISLCKSHHWIFDQRLISVSEDYQVIISSSVSEQELTEWRLAELKGKTIKLPDNNKLYPAQEALEWHRDRLFRE